MKAAKRLLSHSHQLLTKHGYGEIPLLQELGESFQKPLTEKMLPVKAARHTTFADIPGPTSLPLMGALWQYLPGGRFYGMDFNDSVRKLQKLYGDVVKEDLVPGFTVVRLFNPEYFPGIHRAEGELPTRALFGMLRRYNELYNDNKQGLLTSQGLPWQKLRREVQQGISSPRAVRAHIKQQWSVAEEFVDRIGSLRDDHGTVHNFVPEIYKYVTEAIGVVCFDGRLGTINSDNESGQSFIDAVNTSLSLTHQELFTPPLYKIFNTRMFKQYCDAMNTIKSLTEVNIKTALKQPFDRDNMNLAQQLIFQSKLTYSEAFTFLSEFFFGGVDTTGHLLAFSLHALSSYPQCQHKLYEEIKDFTSEDIYTGCLDQSPYLRAFLKETLRMYPVAPGLGRTTSKDATTAGYHIPAGTNIVLHYDVAGKDERFVLNPTQFKPERWIRPIQTPISPYITLPFGFGPRSCPARRLATQEVSLLLKKILQRYRIKETNQDLQIKMQLLNCPSQPLSFTFIER